MRAVGKGRHQAGPADLTPNRCATDSPRGAAKMSVKVLLSGKLRLDGYGKRRAKNPDGTMDVLIRPGGTIRDVEREVGVPPERVAMTMVNGRNGSCDGALRPGDRVILIPSDVAVLWRFIGVQNLGMDNPLGL